MVKTRITEMFNIEYPIICGAMMWLGVPELVAAVNNAGGMGTLTAAIYPTEEEFRAAIHKTRELTDKSFMVGVTILPSIAITDDHYKMYLRVCAEEAVAGVEASGYPIDKACGREYLVALKDAGVLLFQKIGALRHALHVQKAGYDGVYAAGIEEGGHPLNDDVSTMILTPKLSRVLDIPVVTTGGIADGSTLAAALTLGAEGVMMASRFMVTKECQIHQNIKQAIIEAQENDTQLIGKTLHLQCRGLKNDLLKGGYKEMLPLMSGKWAKEAYVTGDAQNGLFTVGQSIGLIDDMPTMSELLTGMVEDAKTKLSAVQASLGK
jgi:nitronate monooxygenase